MPLMGTPEGNGLKIDTVSQNRLNAIKNITKFNPKSLNNLKSVLWFKRYSIFQKDKIR